jgi:diguanylate cyclase (GGDEF)-like protein/PAS domain S-box-containing protein
MKQLDAAFLRQIIDTAPDGIVICDAQSPEYPVIHVNTAFEAMTGYAASELLGGNLRVLQAADRDQDGRRRMREALLRGDECRVMVRNYRKNGDLFWNEIYLQPLRNSDGALTHYVGFHRDASSRLKSVDRGPEGLPVWLREDRVSGLSSRPWFDELLSREWRIARRENRPLTLVLFDIDAMTSYNETYGKAAGDACIKRIARTIAGEFRRGSDVVARWDEAAMAVLAVHREGDSVAGIVDHAASAVRKVAEMRVHHPRSPLQKYITVTAGLATVNPEREEERPERLMQSAIDALREAKRDLRGGLNQAPDTTAR